MNPSTTPQRARRIGLGPWAISEEGLHLVMAVWSRGDLWPAALQNARAQKGEGPYVNSQKMSIADGVATIPVCGPMFRHADMMSDISGATSYQRIGKDLNAAVADPAVRGILLSFDSPGGEVTGCGELAERIRAATKVKPVVAYAEGACTSAAYHLGIAANRLYAAPSAVLGSIGVRCALMDDSGAQEQEGMREIEIVSSQSPGKRGTPVDDDVIARAQACIDALAEVFVADVARFRGVSVEKVLADFGQGDVLVGARAVAAGLADELGTYDAALGGLESLMEKTPQGAPAAPASAPAPAQDPGTAALIARLGGQEKAMARLAELELAEASAKTLQEQVARQPDRRTTALAMARAANLAPAQLAVLESFAADPGVPVEVLEAQVAKIAPPVQTYQAKPFEPQTPAASPSAPSGSAPAVQLSAYDQALFAAAGISPDQMLAQKQAGAVAIVQDRARRAEGR